MNRMVTALSLATLLAGLVFVMDSPTAAQARRTETGFAVKHDVSPALSSVAQRTPREGAAEREVPIKVPSRLPGRAKPADAGPDRLRQKAPGSGTTPAPLLSFEGISDDDNSRLLGFRVVPPDTQGDVGRNQYVQWVNLLMAVAGERGMGGVRRVVRRDERRRSHRAL